MAIDPAAGNADHVDSLQLLSTFFRHTIKPFVITGDTSAATALATRMAAFWTTGQTQGCWQEEWQNCLRKVGNKSMAIEISEDGLLNLTKDKRAGLVERVTRDYKNWKSAASNLLGESGWWHKMYLNYKSYNPEFTAPWKGAMKKLCDQWLLIR